VVENTPPFPQGSSAFKRWAQWVQRSIIGMRANEVPGSLVNRTTRGISIIAKPGQGGGAGMDWQGEWVSTKHYGRLALVRVTTIPPELVGDGKNYTGVWLAVKAGSNHRPIWPEPVATADLYWVMLAMGVREINVSSDDIGAKQMLTSCNDPYTA
jgi:hypothetical protein